MSETRTIAHNTASLAVARATSLAVSFATVPVLTRFLGPDLYGVYSLTLVLNSFLLSVTDLGIQLIATREASKDPTKAEFYAGQAVIIRALSTFAFAALAIVIIFFSPYPQAAKVGFAILAASAIFNAIDAGLAVFLQANLKIYLFSLSDMIGRITSSLLSLAAIFISMQYRLSPGQGIYLIFVGLLIGAATSAILTTRLSLKTRVFRIQLHTETARALLRDSIPMWVVSIFSLINYRVDTVLLSLLKTSYDVGLYNLSYKLLDITLAFPAFFMASVFPLLSRKLDNEKEFHAFAQKAFDALILGAVPIGFGIFATAPQIIDILGGPAFSSSIDPLRILAIAGIFSYLSQYLIFLVVIKNKQTILIVVTLISMFVNIVLNLIFIPQFSYHGAAAVTLVSESLNALMLAIVTMKIHHIRWKMGATMKALLMGLIMLGIVYITPTKNIVILAIIGAAVYAAGAYLLKIYDKGMVLEIISRKKSTD